ncbi:hypothetical protein MBM_03005 [Drepanopeziza brunnea f. sp. 'multigermtubi' MB_m1]|uniref:Uncharacterized protein n=1 Tax=Marssonina brunnea f. sp. multigermtubi (strain MB_m1) TaxID=1072389 RepID=K1XD65_MARBU|nr:uncharacterized protein MBM_03005 [Drepanopeziza brunnea f. sp. 'multigermtubi' MB_m1]EKD18763.1 hypothetical protein MBM_03005 [Drepanopeziza brunnea f. sp. 'multigermtubi' MB_m1]
MKVYRDGEGAGRDSWTTTTHTSSSSSPPSPDTSPSSSPHSSSLTSTSTSSSDPTTSTTALAPTEEFPSIDDEILTKMERRRKAIIWFSVSEALREKYLTDMGGRDKTSEDVMRRLFENVAPPGTKYQALETLKVEEHMRESVRRARERCSRVEREKGEGDE